MARILVVDDEAGMRRILGMILKESGHAVTEASGVEAARREMARAPFDLVVTDQRMPDGEGLALLDTARELDPTLSTVVITAHTTVELAVEAMRRGAFDFIPKPFEPDAVRVVVRRALERTELLRENASLRGAVSRLGARGNIVGESPAMRRLQELIDRVAPTGATVLITGETGSGKELVARAIHERSPRAEKPFVAVNCAAFTETLLDSELFGHEKGAFTGADRLRQGLFEAADKGTLFLDEAAEMTLPLQAKLLRVLVEGEVVRLGSTAPRRVNVRILAATHRDLRARVEEGLFRDDLYYRLAVVPVAVPSLRERPGDLPLLVQHFLRAVAVDLKTEPRTICPAAIEKLASYRFPGNVRELRNLIERACILARGPEIGPEDFLLASDGGAPAPPPDSGRGGDLRTALEEVEQDMIRRALRAAGGVQAQAARRLGISRSDMTYKIKKYGI